MNAISNAQVNGSGNSQSSRATPAANDVRVDGLEISWPDDGWYEVQSATSYNTMSEGGRSATLPHGTYNVINHTTGERFENIVIGNGMSILAGFDGTQLPQPGQLLERAYAQDEAVPVAANSDVSLLTEDSEPVSISIPTLVGDVNITVTPESGNSWEDIHADNNVIVGVGLGVAAATGKVTKTPLVPALVGIVAAGDVITNVGTSVDIEVEHTPNAFAALWRIYQSTLNSFRLSSGSHTQDADSEGGISSTDSAEASGYGTDLEGEFGGTPTAPVAEPVSQSTSTRPANDPNRNSSGDTDNGPGGGGISSSQSASDGGWGSSRGGEFD